MQVQVPPSAGARLSYAANKSYATIVAAALRTQKVDAVADYASFGDWWLSLRLKHSWGSDTATPVFALIDPIGREFGEVETRPMPFSVWKQGRPDILRQAAAEAAPRLASILRDERAERVQEANAQAARTQAGQQAREREARDARQVAITKPVEAPRPVASSTASTSTAPSDRPFRVALTGISGAPGNGNQVLTWLVRDKLRALGCCVVLDTATGADFTVHAKVDDIVVDAQTRRIEIFWHIYTANNEDVGEIVQLNEVPAGSLDRYWGKLAATVTDEAAGGIRDIMLTQTGRR